MPDLPRLFADEPVARHDACRLADVAKAITAPARVQILALIAARPDMCAGEVMRALGTLSQPTISHHLDVLTEAGLVIRRPDGQYVRYTVDRDGVTDLSLALWPRRLR
jgi:ArsR family transcriptional regulator